VVVQARIQNNTCRREENPFLFDNVLLVVRFFCFNFIGEAGVDIDTDDVDGIP
jgi:hypothetical protein